MTDISEGNYKKLFIEKKAFFDVQIDDDAPRDYFESNYCAFRHRAEFSILRKNNQIFYGMTVEGKKETVSSFPIASNLIQELMVLILDKINNHTELSSKLFQIEFQSSRNGEAMISLIYHKQLGQDWLNIASIISKEYSISIIGRSKKQVEVIGKDFVTEIYNYSNKTFPLRLYDQCFSQTNPDICDEMLNWVSTYSQKELGDVMELHCGLGTFTIPLSHISNKVLATENSRPSIKALKLNIDLNKRKNIYFGRLSGRETLEAYRRKRSFRRLDGINLDEFNVETIFLDPPREGLDKNTLEELKNMKNIIYISCGFESFVRDLNELSETHQIVRTAMFDQFPYTDHIESGAILERIAPV